METLSSAVLQCLCTKRTACEQELLKTVTRPLETAMQRVRSLAHHVSAMPEEDGEHSSGAEEELCAQAQTHFSPCFRLASHHPTPFHSPPTYTHTHTRMSLPFCLCLFRTLACLCVQLSRQPGSGRTAPRHGCHHRHLHRHCRLQGFATGQCNAAAVATCFVGLCPPLPLT